MSEPVKCCGTCNHLGDRIWPDDESMWCDYPIPEWIAGKLNHPLEMAVSVTDGAECKAYQPKEAPMEETKTERTCENCKYYLQRESDSGICKIARGIMYVGAGFSCGKFHANTSPQRTQPMNTDERYLQEATEIFREAFMTAWHEGINGANLSTGDPFMPSVKVIAAWLKKRDEERDANIFCEWKITSWNTEGPELTLQFKNGTVLKTEVSEEDAEDWHTDVLIECAEDLDKAGYRADSDGFYEVVGDVPTRWRPFIELRKNMIDDYVAALLSVGTITLS